MITFRQDLQIMKTKIDGITASVFSSMADKVEQTLTGLYNNLDNTVDSLGMRGTWNDNVSVEISGNVRTGFKSMIESCKNPACELIDAIGINSESLLMKLTEYLTKWEEYKKLLKEKETLVSNEPPRTIYNSKTKEEETNSEWNTWKENVELLEFAIKSMEITIQGLESSSNGLIGTLKSLLGPITNKSISSLPLSQTTSSLENGNKKVSNRIVNQDGTVTETYTIYDEKGNEIGVGNINYDQAGTKVIEEYSLIQSDGSKKIATITYNGKESNETYSIVNTDGTIVYNSNSEANVELSNNEVVKLIKEENAKEELPSQTTIETQQVEQVKTNTTVAGLTEKENAFINDNANDNNKLRLFYNGEEIDDNSLITIKEGETIQVIVKIPTNEGEHIDLCRATSDGSANAKSGGISQYNSVSPNRYDKNAILKDTGYYIWNITGQKGGDTYQISQTAQFNTENRAYYNSERGNGAFKEMCNLHIKVE